MLCYRHPKVETNVACGRCEKPICARCMVSGPAGMRCPDCSSLRGSALYKIHPARLILTAAAALVIGILGAFVLSFVSFFVFFIGPAYGGFVAEVVLRFSGRKRGPLIEAVGVGSIVLGALIVLIPRFIKLPLEAIAPMLMTSIWPLLGIGLAVAACYGRLKYL